MKEIYKLTPEHEAELQIWKQKWIDNAFSVKAMDEHDKEQMRVAMRGLYKAANLEYPGDNKIIFVSSPITARFVSGFAMSYLRDRECSATQAATQAADQAATQVDRAATQAYHAADQAATRAADHAADQAYQAVTQAVTQAATHAADQAAYQADQVAAQTDQAAEQAYQVDRAVTQAATHAADQAADQADQVAAQTDQAATRAADQAADQAYQAVTQAAAQATQAAEQAYQVDRAATQAYHAADQAVTQAAAQAATQAYHAADQAYQAATQAATRAATQAADQADQVAAQTDQAVDKKRILNFSFNAFIETGRRINSRDMGVFALKAAAYSRRFSTGGNLYPWRVVYGGFFKHIAKMDITHGIDFTHYDAWELACAHGGFRFMHPKFTIISDRPEILKMDSQNRMHCEDGCAMQWRDGLGIYYWHGTAVPEWIILHPEQITIEEIFKETNAEIRRIMCERFGFRKFGQTLIDSGKAKLISEQDVWGELVKYYHFNDGDATMGFIHVINGTTEVDGTKHEFILTVKADNDNAKEAVMSTYPQLMERLKTFPNKWEIIKKSVRT